MKPEPVFEAAEAALSGYTADERTEIPVILLTPQGRTPHSAVGGGTDNASPAIALICGHYAGVDERIAEGLATRQVSAGDYVLTGGELPAMIIIDAVTRLLPGVVGPSHASDSITTGLLQHPLYTRPAEYRGMAVPRRAAFRPPRGDRPLAAAQVPRAHPGPTPRSAQRTLPSLTDDLRYLSGIGYQETPSHFHPHPNPDGEGTCEEDAQV